MIQNLFFIVRHGRTEGNEDNVYRGWSNAKFAQLDAAGRNDVREAGIFLKKTGVVFPLIFSDDLDRCLESREILADILGIKEQITDRRLRPVNVGDFAGKSKTEYPLDKYFKDKKLRIPGGESLSQFDIRRAAVFADVCELVEKIEAPILTVDHGSGVSYLYNAYNQKESKVGYEGLTDPGGVLTFTTEGVIPLLKSRKKVKAPLKDGTALSGFVTAQESPLPRSCWNCKWFVRVTGLGACTHPVVRIDPDLQERKQVDGTIAVSDNDCCDNFQKHIST
jgi:broad specificity phosphatase PhoE